MKIIIPSSVFLKNFDSFAARMDLANSAELDILVNPKWCAVHPVVLSMLCSIGREQIGKNGKVNVPYSCPRSAPYLIRMGLYEFLGAEPPRDIKRHDSSGRFIPVKEVKNKDDIRYFLSEIVPLLHGGPEEIKPIKYVVSELLRNVFEHAGMGVHAFISAQYYPKPNRVSIGIADRGMGIHRAMSQSHIVRSSLESIRLALQPGITGTTTRVGGTAYNAGAGLYFTRNISRSTGNEFLIYSGDSLYRQLAVSEAEASQGQLFNDPFVERSVVRQGLPYWQGTIVGIDLSVGGGVGFDALIEKIRESYRKGVSQGNRGKYKKPDFI